VWLKVSKNKVNRAKYQTILKEKDTKSCKVSSLCKESYWQRIANQTYNVTVESKQEKNSVPEYCKVKKYC